MVAAYGQIMRRRLTVVDPSIDRRLAILFVADAQKAIPAEMSVLPSVKRRLAQGRSEGGHSRLLLTGLAVIMLGLFVTATPARAAVGDLVHFAIQRFGTVLMTSPMPSPGQSHLGNPSGIQAGSVGGTPSLTLAEAQAQVAFRVPQPTFLPNDVVFRGAMVGPDDQSVVLSYRQTSDASKGMFLQINRGATIGGYAIPASVAESVTVRGQSGVYSKGAEDKSGTWNSSADAGLISWQANGFTYVISFSGLGLNQTDLVRIAESVQ